MSRSKWHYEAPGQLARRLFQLQQDSARRPGMDEGHAASARSHPRALVDGLHAPRPEVGERFVDIVDEDADVVQSRPLLQEPGAWAKMVSKSTAPVM